MREEGETFVLFTKLLKPHRLVNHVAVAIALYVILSIVSSHFWACLFSGYVTLATATLSHITVACDIALVLNFSFLHSLLSLKKISEACLCKFTAESTSTSEGCYFFSQQLIQALLRTVA